jgi:endonuclease YncB( thermonuclease family)
MNAVGSWWTRRSRAQKLLLFVGVATVLIVAVVAASSERTPDQPAVSASSSSTVAFAALPSTSSTAAPVARTTTTTVARPSSTDAILASTTTTLPPTTSTTAVSGFFLTREEVMLSAVARTVVTLLDVIDGDTIRVSSSTGEDEVRLIGIDTPESDEKFSAEATGTLRKLLVGARVWLEMDKESRDQYGRLLAYVWYGDDQLRMANWELVRQGLATVYTVPPNERYVEKLLAAEDKARANQIGVWGIASSSPLRVVTARYDAPGDDSKNLNEEYITFKVLISGTLLGYSVEDQTGHRYRFPDRAYAKGDIFKLHSGAGSDTQADLYWGAAGAAIWNNDGDMVKVLDPRDQIVESFAY